MGGSPFLLWKFSKSKRPEQYTNIIRNPVARPPYRIAAHFCTPTRGCSTYDITPLYRCHWLREYLPIWAPSYRPQHSNYDAGIVLHYNGPYVRNYIHWQAAMQRQKHRSLRRKQILERLIQIYLMKYDRVNRTLSMQNQSLSDYYSSFLEQCLMAQMRQQEEQIDLTRDYPHGDDNIVSSSGLELTNFPSTSSSSYVNEKPWYSIEEPVLPPVEPQPHSSIDLTRDEDYNVSSSSASNSGSEESENEQSETDTSPEEQYTAIDLTDDDVYSVPSPAMEVTVNDYNNNEEREIVEESRLGPMFSNLVCNVRNVDHSI